jgi:hypothetical protein
VGMTTYSFSRWDPENSLSVGFAGFTFPTSEDKSDVGIVQLSVQLQTHLPISSASNNQVYTIRSAIHLHDDTTRKNRVAPKPRTRR